MQSWIVWIVVITHIDIAWLNIATHSEEGVHHLTLVVRFVVSVTVGVARHRRVAAIPSISTTTSTCSTTSTTSTGVVNGAHYGCVTRRFLRDQFQWVGPLYLYGGEGDVDTGTEGGEQSNYFQYFNGLILGLEDKISHRFSSKWPIIR